MLNPRDIPIFILAGGLGTRLKEETEFRPKPMIDIGHRPILWHIMRWYNKHGFNKFVICAGFKSEVIKDFFLNYDALNSDFTVDLGTRNTVYHDAHHGEDWTVTVAYTGESTMTGGRIGRAAKRYLGDARHFGVTYGDGLTDANLADELAFHEGKGRIGTMLAINPPSRFGELVTSDELITKFAEKPELSRSWINGGYFFFRREFTNYLSDDESLVLEQDPLMKLADAGELCAYRHAGYWACMDTQRDHDHLQELWRQKKAPWLVTD